MTLDKKRSGSRLSSLLSLGSSTSNLASTDNADSGSVTSSSPGNRLTKVKQRISSATHLGPNYPPPSPPPPKIVHSLPTIQPVASASAAFEDLPPPPSIADLSCPRSESPSRPYSRSGSRPASQQLSLPPSRPASSGGLQVPGDESTIKKLKRRSGLFGSGPQSSPLSSNESVRSSRGGDPHSRPLAWIAGHAGHVPYNLTMLLNGEKVGAAR